MPIDYNRKLIPRARELRRDMTSEERKLWYLCLRTYPVRFQRQKTIDNFIVDFYCAQAKLAIEIDGSQHYTEDGIVYDTERTAILNGYGITVLRFSNREINSEFAGVCEQIHATVLERCTSQHILDTDLK